MLRQGNKWFSSFPPEQGQAHEIPNNLGVLAVTANKKMFGGHAALILESVNRHGTGRVRIMHLTAAVDGLEALESTGSGSLSSNMGRNEVRVTIQDITVDADYLAMIERLDYQSFVVTNAESRAVIREAEAFQRDVEDGKYVYRKFGGWWAQLTTRWSKKGVNCADFCIAVLKRANIADLKDRLVNTPIRVAGGRRRKRNEPK